MVKTVSNLKIVVAQDMPFYPDQIKKLKSLGKVTFHKNLAGSPDEWLNRCKDADVICSGKFGLKEKIYDLKNMFISLPFVGVDWIDVNRIKKKNVKVAYCPGCNKNAVAEWIIGMMLNMLRNFPKYIKNKSIPKVKIPSYEKSLVDKSVTILGKGNVGTRAGEICRVLGMNVTFFKRGSDLYKSIKDADVIIDALSSNPTTYGLLNRQFFNSLKRGSYFITVTGSKICNIDGMFDALDKGILAGAASDAGSIQIGDVSDPYYRRLLAHPKVLVTPHIAYNTDVTKRVAYDMMIDNVEAWIKGRPKNLLS